METKKLYEEDCMCTRFSAQTLSCRQTAAGFEVVLNATAFFPGGGGQPCDLGTLGGVPVTDMAERDGEILHICAGPLPVGQTVDGAIDWSRRFPLMQQHTGEHLVSGIIHRRYGWNNVGFHMGAEAMTIDFSGPIPTEDLPEIELEANRAIWADVPLRCYYPSPEELEGLSYRSKRAIAGPVRIVEIPGFDRCACCGVHTRTTGQAGPVKILSWVKFHGGTRLELVCGEQAFRYLQQIWEQNRQVSQAFSAKPLETGPAARRAGEQLAAEKFRATGLEKRLYQAIAGRFSGRETAVCFEAGLTPGGVRELAEAMAAHCGVAAVFTPAGEGFSLCLAGAPERVRVLGAALRERFGARGGGKPGFFQGSVKAGEEALRAFFSDAEG